MHRGQLKWSKRTFVLVVACAVCIVFIVVFMTYERAGGEIGFNATVVSVNENWIIAEVSDDNTPFFSKKLPSEIMFDPSFSGVKDLAPGDFIHADYLAGTIDGSVVKVVSIEVIK